MAVDTFLELVSDMITETGYSGGNAPSSVSSATGDQQKVVYWIRIADLQIQRERIDWDFLWGIYEAQLTPNSNVVPSPIDRNSDSSDSNTYTVLVNAIAKKRLAVIDPNGQSHFPVWMEWNEFAPIFNYETQLPNNYPAYWSISPDRTIMLSNPIADSEYNCKYEYWRKPLRMRSNDDVSRIPDDFSRLIVLLAKILYAEAEDAPEVDMGSSANYDLMLNQMLAVHSPMGHWQRMENSDELLVVETL